MASKDGVGKSAGSGKNPLMGSAKLAPKLDLKSSPPPKPKEGQAQVKKPMVKPPTTPPHPEQDKKKTAAAAATATSKVAVSSSSSSPPHKSPASAPLCNDCKAMITMTTSKGAVCFIGNNGRVSACSMSAAGYICKSPKCPNFEQPLVPPASEPKKFLVSKRHTLKNQLSPKVKTKGTKPNTDTNTNNDKTNQPPANREQSGSDDDNKDNNRNKTINNGTRAKGPPSNGGVVEESVETVTLRKQGLQARKEASEWMLNNAIEGVVQKLAPRRENRVKVLVEAFETIISSDEVEGASLEPHHNVPGPIESHRPSPQNVTTRC